MRLGVLLLAAAMLCAGAVAAAEIQPVIVPSGTNDKGVATGDMVLGKPDAPVTVVEYASMTCPHCAHFHATELPQLKQDYIDTGKVRLVFREFPLDQLALIGAMLARCAGPEQYFAVVDDMFRAQEQWARASDPVSELARLAKGHGLDQGGIARCIADQGLADSIIQSRLDGEQKHGIDGTPGFVVDGQKLDEGRLDVAVAAAVKRAASR
jgi:protein-disulfide isomerase